MLLHLHLLLFLFFRHWLEQEFRRNIGSFRDKYQLKLFYNKSDDNDVADEVSIDDDEDDDDKIVVVVTAAVATAVGDRSNRKYWLKFILEYEQVVGGRHRDYILLRMPGRVQDLLIEIEAIDADLVLFPFAAGANFTRLQYRFRLDDVT